jgi:hypothetical protein
MQGKRRFIINDFTNQGLVGLNKARNGERGGAGEKEKQEKT